MYIHIIIPSPQWFSLFLKHEIAVLVQKNPCLVASCLGAKETQTRASSYHWDECGRVASWQM